MDNTNHEDGNFLASMRLYETDGQITAFLRVQGEVVETEVVVPPHMAAMLPQAIGMVKSLDNG
jgi:hypothetical protein